MIPRTASCQPECAAPARGRTRHLHVALEARRRYRLEGTLFGLRGRLMFGDLADAYRLAARMNEVRDAARYPELALNGGELYGAALLHELMHALIESASAAAGRNLVGEAAAALRETLGDDAMEALLRAFVERFPPPPVADGALEVETYLRASSEGVPNREIVVEEALLLWLANANPALERLRELFDDAPLRKGSVYPRAVALLEEGLRARGPVGEGGMSLMELLWAPQRRSPTSLEGQLKAAEELWGAVLGERYAGILSRLLRSVDALREGRARGPGGPGPSPVLDAQALAQQSEIEAFSADSEWMPRVVLVAKSTYVWLAQLERRFGREIRRLDQIPDEALDELAERGFNGLWLIGLWERSEASRRIKQRRGQGEAMASAYALYDYVVASDLGGEPALRELEGRAARRGVRLAGDMVPNHVGIDGRWVAEHPDWFLQLDHPPYPGYRFDGPDLSSHPAMAVMIEDHYWNDSDAAVVFKRVDRGSGETRYLYHGNDGTTMPWNDTAQLDYLNPEVREAVIQTILHVARTVPIIRFDAAMTLAKRHIQRLWYPPPGHGGAIPSRSAYGGMSAQEFERRLPTEFWREVVDRVAQEAPGTLLLAEAFWMMEGYFVRTLGMHRVYNSAFMNMLKREENADYRRLMKNVLEFDPRILGRFVNFMNNPDEETAIAQFGDGDKYFGVATLMATLPGLPMFGHGQVEGFREKYGMEYRAPTFDEQPDARLVERHRREIAPLLHRRGHFANAETFRLYDVHADDGSVLEDVFAYSNRAGGAATLVLYNNRYPRAAGTLHRSVPFAEPWAGHGQRDERLHEALGLSGGEGRFAVLRERRSGLEYLRRSDELVREGLRVSLEGFEAQVFTDIREVRDSDGSYAGLHDALAGAGVPDLQEARLDWRYRAPREAFLALLAAARDGEDLEPAAAAFVRAAAALGHTLRPAEALAAEPRPVESPPVESRPVESRPAASRPGEAHAGEPEPAEARPAEPLGRAARPTGATEREAPSAPVNDATVAALVAALTPARAPGAAGTGSAGGEPAGTGSVATGSAGSGSAGAASSAAGSAGSGSAGSGSALSGSAGGGSAGSAPAGSGSGPSDVAGAALRRAGVPASQSAAWGLGSALRAAVALRALDGGAELYDALRLAGALRRTLSEDGVEDAAAAARLPAALLRVAPRPAEASATSLLAAASRLAEVRELLGVHEHEGTRWFRREGYQLLAAAVRGQAAAGGASRARLEQLERDLARAEADSGYDFDRLLAWSEGPASAGASDPRDASRADAEAAGEDAGGDGEGNGPAGSGGGAPPRSAAGSDGDGPEKA